MSILVPIMTAVDCAGGLKAMRSKTWGEIEQFYSELAVERPDGHFGVVAKHMLEVLPLLRSDIAFTNIRLSTAFLAFCIGFNDYHRLVHLTWNGGEQYTVFLDHSEPTFYGDKTVISREKVAEAIKQYLERLEVEANKSVNIS